MKLLTSLSLCALVLSGQAFASSTEALTIPTLSESVKIDGVLDEPQWQNALNVPINNVTWPYENQPSPVKTHVLVYENGESLFLGFVATDPNPEKIRAFYQDRDKGWNDDMVGFKIDPYNNQNLAYQFFINPLGVQLDSIENEITKQESSAWDGTWYSQGQITDTGYIVEVELPLSVLNFKHGDDIKEMAMEFVRFYPRNERLRLSSMQIDHANSCWICQMHTTYGFKNAKQSANVTIVPAIVAGRSERRKVANAGNEPWQSDTNVEPSLDAKWAITPETSLTATINPDFSQVEADVAQLSINNNFTLFFPEKRSFFLENADYFATPWDLVYTRNVSSPEAGVKLTSSQGNHTFAAFAANDEQTNVIIGGNLGSNIVQLDDKSNNLAARYLFNANDVKLALSTTARQGDGYYNYLTSTDLKYQPNNNDTFIAVLGYSKSKYSDAFRDALCNGENCNDINEPCFVDCPINESYLRVANNEAISDIAYKLEYEHNQKHWTVFAAYNNFGKDFRADLGFITQIDFNKFVTGGRYRWYGDNNTWYNRIEWYTDWDISHNDNGELLEKEFETNISANGPWQSYVQLAYVTRDKVGLRHDKSSLAIDNNTDLFGEHELALYAEMKPLPGTFAAIRLSNARTIDLANNRLGDKVQIRPEINWFLTRHLELRIRHTYESLEADNAPVFDANLTDFRLSYQFNINSFIRFAMIYSDIERNPENYLNPVNSRYKGLSSQLLYSYKLNPQTVFFAGYSDSGYQDDNLQNIERNNRSLFIKLSYAWML